MMPFFYEPIKVIAFEALGIAAGLKTDSEILQYLKDGYDVVANLVGAETCTGTHE